MIRDIICCNKRQSNPPIPKYSRLQECLVSAPTQ